jgi:hypothetical protein
LPDTPNLWTVPRTALQLAPKVNQTPINGSATPALSVAVYALYGMLIWFGAASFWVLPTELLPTHLRARAKGVGNGLARFMVGLTTWIVPTGIVAFGFSGTFLMLSMFGVAIGLYALTGLCFEPNGRDLDELATP